MYLNLHLSIYLYVYVCKSIFIYLNLHLSIDDPGVIVWDLANGKVAADFRKHRSGISCVRFVPKVEVYKLYRDNVVDKDKDTNFVTIDKDQNKNENKNKIENENKIKNETTINKDRNSKECKKEYEEYEEYTEYKVYRLISVGFRKDGEINLWQFTTRADIKMNIVEGDGNKNNDNNDATDNNNSNNTSNTKSNNEKNNNVSFSTSDNSINSNVKYTRTVPIVLYQRNIAVGRISHRIYR